MRPRAWRWVAVLGACAAVAAGCSDEADGPGSSATGGAGNAAGTAGSGNIPPAGGTGGSAPPPGTVSMRAACRAYLTAACTRMGECANDEQMTASCLYVYLPTCPDYLFSPGSARTVDNVLACAEEWSTFPCEDERVGRYPACALSGTLPPGEPCMFGSQCDSGYCSGQGQDCGVCQRIAAQGEDCSPEEVVCPPGQQCYSAQCQDAEPDPPLPDRTPVAPGEACSTLDTCADDLPCLVDATSPDNRICMAPPGAGQPCARIFPTSPPAVCSNDAYCDTSDICQTRPGAGEPCAQGEYDYNVYCAPDAYCDSADADGVRYCAARGGAGAPCTNPSDEYLNVTQCADGLACACVDADCTVGACRYRREEGEDCTGEAMCAFGTECQAGRCVATDEPTLFAEACGTQ